LPKTNHMKGLNKVFLIGHLGKDPEVKKLEKELQVSRFSLATSETYKDSTGKHKTTTDWHTIVMWGSLAEISEKYLHKGSLVYVEGKMKQRSFESKAGEKKYVTEVIAEQIIMLDKK